jgi:hypothetical protein
VSEETAANPGRGLARAGLGAIARIAAASRGAVAFITSSLPSSTALHHDYYELINASSAGAAAPTSFPWTSVGVGFAFVAAAGLLLTRLQLNRRLHRTAP